MNDYTNAEKMKMEEENLTREVEELASEDLPTANIMVAGITGTGKSTLLNAVFGSELASTGKGRPVTDQISEYQSVDIPIHIWDTVGLELDSEKTKDSINSIRQTIASKASSEDKFDRVHAIWYCINSGSNRYQGAELDFIKNLYAIGVPFIIVLTQCIGDEEEVNIFENQIKKINTSMGMDDIEIVKVCAKEYKTRMFTIPAFGLEDLVNITIKKMPQFIKNGFVAAQKVSKVQKRVQCEEIIYQYIKAAKEGFWDKVPLANIISANKKIKEMLMKIGKMYNTVINDNSIDEIIGKCRITFENVFPALISPFASDYSEKVNMLLSSKKNEGFEVKIDSFSKNERVARMIALYGYTFVDSIEEVWEKLTEKQLEDVDMVIRELIGIINSKLNERRKSVRE